MRWAGMRWAGIRVCQEETCIYCRKKVPRGGEEAQVRNRLERGLIHDEADFRGMSLLTVSIQRSPERWLHLGEARECSMLLRMASWVFVEMDSLVGESFGGGFLAAKMFGWARG